MQRSAFLQQSFSSCSVNGTVNPASAQPEAVARSVYNLAERYLVKTLKGAAL